METLITNAMEIKFTHINIHAEMMGTVFAFDKKFNAESNKV